MLSCTSPSPSETDSLEQWFHADNARNPWLAALRLDGIQLGSRPKIPSCSMSSRPLAGG